MHKWIYGYFRCVGLADACFACQRVLSRLPEGDEATVVRKRPGKSVRKCKGLVILGDAPHNRPVYALQHLNIHNGVGVGRFGQAKGKFANRYDFDLLRNGHGFTRAVLRGGGERVYARLAERNAAAVCVERTLIRSACLYAEEAALGQAPVYGGHVFRRWVDYLRPYVGGGGQTEVKSWGGGRCLLRFGRCATAW